MTTQTKDSLFRASIGETVNAWRLARGLQVTELANRAGTTKGYVSGLEKNKTRQPNEDHLVRLATALAIPVEYLVTRRLPDDLSSDERKKIDEKWNAVEHENIEEDSRLFSYTPNQLKEPSPAPSEEDEEGFTFGSPIPSLRRTHLNEEEELREILAQIEELRSRVKKLIARKGRQR